MNERCVLEFNMLNQLYLTVLVASLLLGGAAIYHYSALEKAEARGAEKTTAIYTEQQRLAQKAKDLRDQTIRDTEYELREKQRLQIASLTAANKRLLGQLSSRPSRPTSPVTTDRNPQTIPTCTGAQLYREDGEFLAGEATRAQRVLIERDYYYEQYESVRKLLQGSYSLPGQYGTPLDAKPFP